MYNSHIFLAEKSLRAISIQLSTNAVAVLHANAEDVL